MVNKFVVNWKRKEWVLFFTFIINNERNLISVTHYPFKKYNKDFFISIFYLLFFVVQHKPHLRFVGYLFIFINLFIILYIYSK